MSDLRRVFPTVTTWRTFVLLLLGLLLVQTAWTLVVGPFRAIDEFDHAQRADAVASGEIGAMPGGRVSVSSTFAAAALPVCLSRGPRPGPCSPDGVLGNGRVAVYDTASTYDPAFYLIDGPPGQLFDGYARLYAMRLVASLLTAVAVAAAGTLLLVGFRSRWPGWLFLALATPMATYTNMVVAPNGLESSCALVVWSCLLTALFGRNEVRSSPWPPLLAGFAGVWMGVLRTLGPFWLAMIVVAVLLATRRPAAELRGLLARRGWRAAVVAWVISCGAGVIWSGVAHTNWPTSGNPDTTATTVAAAATASSAHVTQWHLFPDILVWPFLWILQNVGVIPYRDQSLPLVVYAAVVALWVALLGTAWRSGSREVRRASAFVMLVSLVVPVAVSLFTYQLGWPWQGRYGWPLAMGVFLLAGVALDRASPTTPAMVRRLAAPVIGAVMALAGVISQAHVLHGELMTSPLAHSDAWFRLPMPAIGLMTVVGFALMVLAIERGPAAPAKRRHGAGDNPQLRSDPAEAATH